MYLIQIKYTGIDLVLIRNPEKMSIGKKAGPIRPIVASRLGVITAKNVPKPTAVFEAITRRAKMIKYTEASG